MGQVLDPAKVALFKDTPLPAPAHLARDMAVVPDPDDILEGDLPPDAGARGAHKDGAPQTLGLWGEGSAGEGEDDGDDDGDDSFAQGLSEEEARFVPVQPGGADVPRHPGRRDDWSSADLDMGAYPFRSLPTRVTTPPPRYASTYGTNATHQRDPHRLVTPLSMAKHPAFMTLPPTFSIRSPSKPSLSMPYLSLHVSDSARRPLPTCPTPELQQPRAIERGRRAAQVAPGDRGCPRGPPPPPLPLPRTNRTSLVPPLVLSGHAASLTGEGGGDRGLLGGQGARAGGFRGARGRVPEGAAGRRAVEAVRPTARGGARPRIDGKGRDASS